MAFLFYKDIKKDVLAITNENDIIYVFQIGVFKSLDNAENFLEEYPSGGIYKDNDLYRVIIGVTKSNREKLEKILNDKKQEYYVKELNANKDLLNELIQYDEVLKYSDKEEAINNLNKSMVALFLEYQT